MSKYYYKYLIVITKNRLVRGDQDQEDQLLRLHFTKIISTPNTFFLQ